ncbi:RNA polymerase sigma factor [Hymenobacter coccineus]|uniref:RNA polymerase sigma factor n=1 Tax=Hymenobacter coccineus TaxID=1908235 RepID=UPI00130167E0|nr:sigma-70 family RNA polymerase sigma factor [Hymenobacter coccineus]
MTCSTRDDDNEWVQRLRAGDTAAVQQFCQRYRRALLALIGRLVRDPASAENVLQESLLRIWLALASYDSARGRLHTWAVRICTHAAVDHLRSRAAGQARRVGSLGPLAQVGAEPVAPTTFWPKHIGLAALLDQLRPAHQRPLELVYFEGRTYAAAAAEQGVPVGTAKSWAAAAKHRLAQWF